MYMASKYHMIYSPLGSSSVTIEVEARENEDAIDPKKQVYFYGIQGGKRFCFIKRIDPGDTAGQYKTSQLRENICSPYVTSRFDQETMGSPRLEYCEDGTWIPMDGDVLLYEYMPQNLTEFWWQHQGDDAAVLEDFRRQILMKLTVSLAYLHSAGWYHCDIKPDNIMVHVSPLSGDSRNRLEHSNVRHLPWKSATTTKGMHRQRKTAW